METSEENKKGGKPRRNREISIAEIQRKRIREIMLARRNTEVHRISRYPILSNPRSFEERLRERAKANKEELENKALEQNIKLKKLTLFLLFGFLGAETIAIFIIAFFQGFKVHGFHLDEWSFNLIVFATITQITTMLLIAVKHLFPQQQKEQ